jgi:hypothetical protein
MPGGEFIPNESIHYAIVHSGGSLKGEDRIPYDDIGVGQGHRGRLRVTLRFNNRGQATAAIQNLEVIEAKGGKFEVIIEVPTKKHTKDETKADYPNPNAQVRVEW